MPSSQSASQKEVFVRLENAGVQLSFPDDTYDSLVMKVPIQSFLGLVLNGEKNFVDLEFNGVKNKTLRTR